MTDLTWTDARPSKPGWYWWRVNADDAEIVRIFEEDGNGSLMLLGIDGQEIPLTDCDGQWSSAPIAEPREGKYGN